MCIRDSIKAAALGADDRHCQIDQCHQQTTEHTGLDGILRDSLGLLDPQAPDDIDDDDAKGQARQGVHGVIPFQEAGGEGLVDIAAVRRNAGDFPDRVHQRRHDEDAQEQ